MNGGQPVVDFAVIGGGIVGTAIAAHLAAAGSVVLCEREASLGVHTTGRSAAVFVSNYGNGAVRVLTDASRPFFDAPPDGFADAPLLKRRGCLFIASDERREALAAQAAHPSVRVVSTAEALRLVPVLRPEAAAHALFEETACDIDVNGLQQGYLRMLRARGGRVELGCTVEGLERADGVWTIQTDNGSFCARVIVNAAGAWASEVASMAGASALPLTPLRRTAALVPAPLGVEISSWPFTVDVDETVYFKPDAGLVLLSPADETASPACDAQPEELDVATAVYRYEQITTQTVQRVTHKWAGLRVFAPDRLPVIGFDRQAEDFFWCAGVGGFGIQTAPATADLAAALLTTGQAPAALLNRGLDPDTVKPCRPALRAHHGSAPRSLADS